MKTYIVYFSCPFCKNPCCDDPCEEANEVVDADSKTEAREFFNNAKQCRYMKIARIVEDKAESGITNVEMNGVKYDSLEDAISAMRWADKVAEEMTDEELKHLHDNDPRMSERELF